MNWIQPLASVVGVAESAPGMIWISDGSPASNRLVIVREAGGAETVVGRPGEGPGEIRSAGRIAVTPEGNVVMYDILGIAVVEYSATGEPLSRIRLPVQVRWPKGFAVLASGEFVLSGPVLGIDHAIHRFGREGRLVESWGERAKANHWRASAIATGGPVYALGDGSLLYSQGTPHRIVRYMPSEGSRSGSRGIFEMNGGSVLNVVVMSDEGRSVWQLFGPADALGGPVELLAEAEVAKAYHPWFKCENGDVLATRRDTTTDVPVVVRLRVDVSPHPEPEPLSDRRESIGSVVPHPTPRAPPGPCSRCASCTKCEAGQWGGNSCNFKGDPACPCKQGDGNCNPSFALNVSPQDRLTVSMADADVVFVRLSGEMFGRWKCDGTLSDALQSRSDGSIVGVTDDELAELKNRFRFDRFVHILSERLLTGS